MSVPDDYIQNLTKSLKRHNLSMNQPVIEAFRSVPREYFVGNQRSRAYRDNPLSIPKNQTISAPHMYAMMLSREIAAISSGMDVLEIGTGSGYGAALIAKAVEPGQVISIERHKELVSFAKRNLQTLDLNNLEVIHGDGTNPNVDQTFDRIIVTASGPKIPPSYKNLLKAHGRVIMPLEKNFEQWLTVITSEDDQWKIDWKFKVRFVPLVGEHGH